MLTIDPPWQSECFWNLEVGVRRRDRRRSNNQEDSVGPGRVKTRKKSFRLLKESPDFTPAGHTFHY